MLYIFNNFFTDKDVLPERYLLEKAVRIKKFEYLPLRSELRKQTSAAEKRYQKLDKVFKSNIKKEEINSKKLEKKDLRDLGEFKDRKKDLGKKKSCH